MVHRVVYRRLLVVLRGSASSVNVEGAVYPLSLADEKRKHTALMAVRQGASSRGENPVDTLMESGIQVKALEAVLESSPQGVA